MVSKTHSITASEWDQFLQEEVLWYLLPAPIMPFALDHAKERSMMKALGFTLVIFPDGSAFWSNFDKCTIVGLCHPGICDRVEKKEKELPEELRYILELTNQANFSNAVEFARRRVKSYY